MSHDLGEKAPKCELCGAAHKNERSRKWCIYWHEFMALIDSVEITPFDENGTMEQLPGWERFEGHLDSSYLWHYVSEAVLKRDNRSCTSCGQNCCALEVHHIIPRFKGGKDNPVNLRSLCKKCHAKITGEQVFERVRLRRKAGTLEDFVCDT